MEHSFIEANYPTGFRADDAKHLGEFIRHRQSIELVGMTRVGISNFLRFFLYHKEVVNTYINHGEKHLFIPVDLNDLVEINIFPFWILTFKRVVDAVEKFPLDPKTKEKISSLFLNCIQSKDLFLTVDSIRQALNEIGNQGTFPTIFFIRFDRIKNLVTDEFFANLQGLIDATAQKLTYVFTGSRTLEQISPNVFTKKLLLSFSRVMSIKPAKEEDMRVIFETFEKKYNVSPSEKVLQSLLELSGGHVQYLQLCLIVINEFKERSEKEILDYLQNDISGEERIILQSEEIWDSLTKPEQEILKKILSNQKISDEDREVGKYLWDTGILVEKAKIISIFSPLFDHYLRHNHKISESTQIAELTKKESQLFNVLLENKEVVCERDKIIQSVWPEYEELGVSDWTIDRLVSRLRDKLKQQKSQYSLVTVKTRGYKLVTS